MKQLIAAGMVALLGVTTAVAAPKTAGQETRQKQIQKGGKHEAKGLRKAEKRQSKEFKKAHKRAHKQEQRSRVAQRLDLSEQQRSQLREMRTRDRERNEALRLEERRARQEYLELRQAKDPRAEAAGDRLSGLRERLKQQRQQSRQEMLTILTPEQRASVERLFEQRGERR